MQSVGGLGGEMEGSFDRDQLISSSINSSQLLEASPQGG